MAVFRIHQVPGQVSADDRFNWSLVRLDTDSGDSDFAAPDDVLARSAAMFRTVEEARRSIRAVRRLAPGAREEETIVETLTTGNVRVGRAGVKVEPITTTVLASPGAVAIDDLDGELLSEQLAAPARQPSIAPVVSGATSRIVPSPPSPPSIELQIAGDHLASVTRATLTRAGEAPIQGAVIGTATDARLTARFPVSGAPAGSWILVVGNPAGPSKAFGIEIRPANPARPEKPAGGQKP